MTAVQETVALLALVGLLYVVVRQPRRIPEVAAAVPAVGVLLAIGAVSWSQAHAEIDRLGPVVGFLAAVLVIAAACDAEGVFRAAGSLIARRAGSSAAGLLLVVVGFAAVTTAALSLDTTVVLLTPVVVSTLRVRDARPRPHLYATAHLANSASLLLPVSNLTNLLAFAVVPVSFPRFAALMALPWLIAIAVETVGARLVFGADFASPLQPAATAVVPFPRFASTVVVLTVAGFAVGSVFGLAPVWVATAGAVVLSVRRLMAGTTGIVAVVRSAAPSFCLFVLGLGIVVVAVSTNGFDRVVRDLLPSGSGLLALLGVAAVAAVLSNVMNNLPATLVLLPIAAVGGVGPALAVLIGVDIGPNLTYSGSLATLLWRRAVAEVDDVPTLRDFTVLGLVTVPLAIAGSTVALWLALKVVGG